MNLRSILRHSLLAATAMTLLCACSDDDDSFREVKVGDTVPAFVLRLSDGRVFDSAKDIDRTALIAFFNTGCQDCRDELPVLQQVFDSLGQDIDFILISREQPESEIAAYWKGNGLTMPYFPQEDRAVFSKFAESGIPRGYIADRNRTVRFVFSDKDMPDYNDLRKQIEMKYEQD